MELSFSKDEQLRVFKTANQNWWQAESLTTGAKGWIPSNYVVCRCRDCCFYLNEVLVSNDKLT